MKNIGQIDRKVREGEKIQITGKCFLSPEINFFFLNVFYLPELTSRKSVTIQCARWTEKISFFGNAQPKSNARAHLKQRTKTRYYFDLYGYIL